MNAPIDKVDISVFKAPTETSPEDRVALELIREFISGQLPSYNYLELGSYLGGTLLPHVLSSKCQRILSVAKRVSSQPDERRARGYSYKGVTTADLIDELGRHVTDRACLSKLSTHDGVVDDLDPAQVLAAYPGGFQLCFIDAEHTNEAVFSDFLHTHRLAAADSVIMLHDSWMLGSGIKNIISYLQFTRTPFYFCPVRDSVSSFFFGRFADPAHVPELVRSGRLDLEGWFAQINKRLWDLRKRDVIKNLSAAELTTRSDSLPTAALITLLRKRVRSRLHL